MTRPIFGNLADSVVFTGVGDDAPRPNLDFKPRLAVVAVVFNRPATHLLVLRKKEGGAIFVTGGIDEGQTPEMAARVEVMQEAGYTDLELISELPGYQAMFYHGVKGVNRHACFSPFLFRLTTDATVPVSEKELALHSSQWVPVKKIGDAGLQDGYLYLLGAVAEIMRHEK